MEKETIINAISTLSNTLKVLDGIFIPYKDWETSPIHETKGKVMIKILELVEQL